LKRAELVKLAQNKKVVKYSFRSFCQSSPQNVYWSPSWFQSIEENLSQDCDSTFVPIWSHVLSANLFFLSDLVQLRSSVDVEKKIEEVFHNWDLFF